MRIAHFLMGRCNPDSSNGVDKTIYHLAAAQARRGEEVAVFSVTSKEPLEIPGVRTFCFEPHRFGWRVPAQVVAELRAWAPDVVQVHSVYVPGNAQVGMALRRAGIPYVVTPNGGLSPHVRKKGSLKKLVYGSLFERPLLTGAAFVHSVGDTESILDFCGAVKSVTAPNAVEDLGDPVPDSRRTLDSRFPAVRGRRLFMFLGRLDPYHKGLDLLIEAFSRVPRSSAALALVGPDFREGRRFLEARVLQLGLGGCMIMPGAVHGRDKLVFLSAADVFVHTSRYEGLPFAVLEACALGRPCLVTPAADPLGRLGKLGAGIVCGPDVASIHRGLEKALAMDQGALRHMGESARAMVAAEFTWDRSAGILSDAFSEARIGVKSMSLTA